MSDQPALWTLPEPITVHCVFCDFMVITGDGPDHAHDVMEGHYRGQHRADIDRVVSS